MQSSEFFKDAEATGRKEAGVFVDPICQGCTCRKSHFFYASHNRTEHKTVLGNWAKIPGKDK